ncbi:hypothetical protein MRX96_016526 [Rhipicephalus microplus]
MCHGMLRSFREVKTIEEARAWPASLTASWTVPLGASAPGTRCCPLARAVTSCGKFLFPCRPTPGRLRRHCGRQFCAPFALAAPFTSDRPFE